MAIEREELKKKTLAAASAEEIMEIMKAAGEEITAEDMPLNRYIMNDLRKYLTEEIFRSRCGVSVELRVRYIPYDLPEPKEP